MTLSPLAALKSVGRKLRGTPVGKALRPKRVSAGEERFLADARSAFPGYAFDTVFDVGANVGKISTLFRLRFPDAAVHAFEPAPEAFRLLTEAFGDDPRFFPSELALGARDGVAGFSANGASTINRLMEPGPDGGRSAHTLVEVAIATGDAYCRDRSVDRISFLKIDTEGHDLEVLTGFAGMLDRQAVDFIQVEAGMHPENRRHVPFRTLQDHLDRQAYRAFRVYEQRSEKRLPILRRCNIVFVSLRLAEAFQAA